MAISDKNIMHITKAELFTFLINPPARGILQRWITPQRKRDHCIHATWKPHVFLCERVQNVYQVDDPKVSLERRTAGDLGGVDVQMASCAPDLVKRIRSMCEALASETRRCDRVNIVHMQLRFKLDEHNHMWCALSVRVWRSGVAVWGPCRSRSRASHVFAILGDTRPIAPVFSESCSSSVLYTHH